METYIVHPDKSQEKTLREFLEAINVPFECINDITLPAHVLTDIQKGQEDAKDERTISLATFKEKLVTKR